MIETKIGIKISDKKLLKQALTHPSKSKENYQRLEYLGDSILDFLVGEYLYINSEKGEGDLTVLRAHYVSEENLAKVFDELQLESDIILGKSMQNNVTRAIKADIIEAIIAVIYLDKGLEVARHFVTENLHLQDFNKVEDDNYKSQLQELIQANFKCTMKYVTTKDGDNFIAQFFMDEDLIATGYGKDKLHAEQNCAYLAIDKLFKD